MILPELRKYKSNKILTWSIKTDHYPAYSTYTITHGQLKGKLQTTTTEVRSGKNLGKANETTVEKQCDLEAKALWQKQIDRKGYSDPKLCVIPASMLYISPMLAVEYDKFAHKVKFPCYVQPKLDGVRCLAYLDSFNPNNVILQSRQRKEFNHLNHIRSALLPIFKERPHLILDGELYSHNYTFQEIISAIKRDEPNHLTAEVEYHIYDIVSNKPYKDRYKELQTIAINEIKFKNRNSLKWVYTSNVIQQDGFEEWHRKFTSQGYEGIMIRNADGLYKQDGRSQDLLKYKKFIDQEFPIVGAEQNKGKLSNTCTFQLSHNNVTFSAMPEGSLEEREQLYEDWKNGVIKKGDLATVKFFSWTTGQNPIPRFPILKSIRNYE